ncbi:MAG: MFS transporter, partial [Pseudomonadota bacterium]|nr:MFS transporter [Pseudomonadota bacterium]
FAATAVLMVIVGSVALGQVALVTIMAVQGVMHGLIMPSRDMIVRAVTPDGSMGKVYGFVSTGLSLGSAIGPMIYGALLDWGEPRLVFYVIAGFMVLSMATVFTSTKGRAVVR